MKQRFRLVFVLITILSTACWPTSRIESCKVSERNLQETPDFKPLWSESNIFVVYSNALDPALTGLNSDVFAVVHRRNSVPSEIVSLDTQSGKLKWQRKVNIPVTIVASDTALYVASYDDIQEYDPQTGKPVRGTNFKDIGNIYNLFVNDQTLYALSSSGRWISYNLEDYTYDLSERFLPYTPFVIDNEILYSYDSEGFKATQIVSGETLWKHPINEPINSHPLFVDDVIIILSVTGNIYVLDKETGNLLWNSEAKVLSNLAAGTSQLYFLTTDGYLKVLNIREGQEVQKLEISSTPFGVNSPRSDTAIGVYNIWVSPQNQTVIFSLGDSCQLIALELESQ
jgi:outer membrane protein assembly factor BamB